MATPLIYIKRLLDVETLKLYVPALTKAIEEKAPHSARTMVDTLHAVVMGRVPKRARLTKVLNRIRTQNVMGARGENTITFSEGLMFDLKQSGWAEMSMAEAGCLMWLSDLTLTNVHHMELSWKVHLAWDLAVSKNEPFTIQNCMQVALDHWSKVRETELTMGPKQSNGGNNKTDETPSESQPHKRRKRNKKSKDSQQDGAGIVAAATKDKGPAIPPKDPPKAPPPSYCFRCGESDHTSRACKHMGDL